MAASRDALVKFNPIDFPSGKTVFASSRINNLRLCALPSKPPHESAI